MSSGRRKYSLRGLSIFHYLQLLLHKCTQIDLYCLQSFQSERTQIAAIAFEIVSVNILHRFQQGNLLVFTLQIGEYHRKDGVAIDIIQLIVVPEELGRRLIAWGRECEIDSRVVTEQAEMAVLIGKSVDAHTPVAVPAPYHSPCQRLARAVVHNISL